MLRHPFTPGVTSVPAPALANAALDVSQRGQRITVKGKKLPSAVLDIKKGGKDIDVSNDHLGDGCAMMIARMLPRQ